MAMNNEWSYYISTLQASSRSIEKLARCFADYHLPKCGVGMWWYVQAQDADPLSPYTNPYRVCDIAASILMGEADRRRAVEKRGRHYLKVGSQSLSKEDLRVGRELLKVLRKTKYSIVKTPKGDFDIVGGEGTEATVWCWSNLPRRIPIARKQAEDIKTMLEAK